MDADRMDYLLRDSLHAGVDYGKYDWKRLVNTIQVISLPQKDGESNKQGLRIGIAESGIHAAEALVLARYYMFSQVYFHKTRVAYDFHIKQALQAILPFGVFPMPDEGGIESYLSWDDWRVLGLLSTGNGGEHGKRICQRAHYREVHHTPERPNELDRKILSDVTVNLGELLSATVPSSTSAYKLDRRDIAVVTEDSLKIARPLSFYSSIVRNLEQNPIDIVRIYSTPENAQEARSIVSQTRTGAMS